MQEPSRQFGRYWTTCVSFWLAVAVLCNASWAQGPRRDLRTRAFRTEASESAGSEFRVAQDSLAIPLETTRDGNSLNPPQPAREGGSGNSGAATSSDNADEDDLQPLGREELTVPLRQSADSVIVESEDGLISLVARGAPLQDVITALADLQGLNIITQTSADATLNTSLHRVPFEDALDVILAATGHTWSRNKNILQITSIDNSDNIAPEVQGRRVEVFPLNYVSATDVNSVVSSLLSPAGNSFVVESAEDDNRRTQELLVVEDLPRYLAAIRRYLRQHDVPPRQVLVEAYILEVDLSKDRQHGVNFEHLFDVHGNLFQVETRGFASPTTSQAFLVNLSGGNLTALIECLETTADAKTLAAPKIRVLNGQQARIQVGEQLGFRVTTTTQTSTTESVEFLDVGVVLEVTPRISSEGTVIMRVSPEVSSGEVNPSTGLPEEATTELETDVMFRDNQAFVVGGLIQEKDTNSQLKLPWFGDIKYLGKLFQRREVVKNRTEIIVALLPRVMPFEPATRQDLEIETQRTQTPLLHGPLHRYPRPWEPQLPDAIHNPSFSPLPKLPDLRALQHPAHLRSRSRGKDAADGMSATQHPLAPQYETERAVDIRLPPPPVHTTQLPQSRPTGSIRMTRLPPPYHAPRFHSAEEFDRPRRVLR